MRHRERSCRYEVVRPSRDVQDRIIVGVDLPRERDRDRPALAYAERERSDMVIELEIDTGDKGPTSYCACILPFANIWKTCPRARAISAGFGDSRR